MDSAFSLLFIMPLLFFMTLGTAGSDGKGSLSVVAGTTGLALLHLFHGYTLATAIGERLGMAIRALVSCGVEVMTEIADDCATAVFVGQVGRFVTDMAFVAVAAGGECGLAIVTAAA